MGRRRDEILERAGKLPELRGLAEAFPVALKAQGARIFDVDNVGYIDYVAGGGSAIFGYANQYILDAVKKVVTSGIPRGLHTQMEVELAETLQQFLPWTETLYFSQNEGAATQQALDLARSITGKERFLALDGGRLFEMGPDLPAESRRIRKLPGWNLDKVEAALTAGASKIAALIIDPLMSGGGLIPAPEGALKHLAEVCTHYGVLLILDERISGFRLARGGAAEWAEIVPDIAIYGDGLGGGYPLGVVALSRSIRETESKPATGRAPHLISLGAAEAVLSILKNDSVFVRLEERCTQLVEGILSLAERFSRSMRVNRIGSVFSIYFTRADEVSTLAGALESDEASYQRLATGLRAEGVLLPSEPLQPTFVSSAHSAKDIDETLEAFERVLMRLHQEDLP